MIYDIDNNQIQTFSTSVNSEGVLILTIRVDCKTGLYLSATEILEILVEAKRISDIAWVNIQSNPILLTPYAGTQQDFEIRLVADEVTEHIFSNFKITVS